MTTGEIMVDWTDPLLWISVGIITMIVVFLMIYFRVFSEDDTPR
jgi:uncharacterized membrane protein